MILPVIITVFSDKSFTFILKSPPASVLLKKAANIASGSARPNQDKVGKVNKKQLLEIYRLKQKDLNAKERRGGHPHHRRHRPQHGHRGRRLNSGKNEFEAGVPPGTFAPQGAKHGKTQQTLSQRRPGRRSRQGLSPERGRRHPGEVPEGQVRRDRRAFRPPRRRPDRGRPDGPRHDAAAERLGQEGPRPRLHRQRRRRPSTPAPTMPASRT